MGRQLSLREQQRIELEMLLVLKDICKKNHLYYTLAGGTLLGAIRHKGFIPWDDDIDVLMPRTDFDKLNALIKNNLIHLPDHLKILNMYSSSDFELPFIKIVDLRTSVEELYTVGDKYLWIDIFAMDGSTENNYQLKRQFAESKLLRQILFKKKTKPGTGKTAFKRIGKSILRTLLKPFNAKSICKKIEHVSTRYSFENSKYIAGVQWGYGPQERIHKEEWLMPIDVEFEGELFNAPSNYDEYLSNLYGNYMEIPPLDKRITHDTTVYFEDKEDK